MSAEFAAARLDESLRAARSRGASDLHLQSGRPPLLRIDGALSIFGSIPIDVAELDALLPRLLSPVERARFESVGDTTVMFAHESGPVRAHCYRSLRGIAVAVRLLPSRVPTLSSLGVPAAAETFSRLDHGLVIVGGPTGSGKSTTLAALVDAIDRRAARHIITLEDPIEYQHRPVQSLISQRRVGLDVPTFDGAIESALRSDPDVLVVGEMRNAATMQAAIAAAETGHLVLTTAHAGEAPQIVDRIVGAFAADAQNEIRLRLAQALAGVISMRLVPLLGGGRRPACEILAMNEAVRALIRDGKTHQLRNAILCGREMGMQTLEADLNRLLRSGLIAYDRAIAATNRPCEIADAVSA